jgi:2'-5' RNA ligase
MISKGYSLWLMPRGTASRKFKGLVKKLADENNAPIFQPHVTLLGDFMYSEEESIKKTKQLVLGQSPFTIEMEKIDFEDYFFRTLFVRAKKTEKLMALNNRAREVFKVQDQLPFMPHLSLLYGIFPLEKKEQIIKEVGRDQSVIFEVNSVILMKGGEIKDWRIIGEFPFLLPPR